MTADDDFLAYRSDRWEATYERGGRKLTVPVEGSFDGAILSVYLNRVDRWDPPHESAELTAGDRQQIAADFVESFRRQNIAVEIDPSE